MQTSTKVFASIGFAATVGASLAIATYDGPVEAKTPVKTPADCEQDFKAATQALYKRLELENPGKSGFLLSAKMAKHPEGKQAFSDFKACQSNYAKSISSINVEIFGHNFKFD